MIQKKKEGEAFAPPVFFSLMCRLLVSSFHRANAGASSAVDALTLIDNVLAVTLGNSFLGALSSASTAGDALIIDHICHSFEPPFEI